MNGRLSLVLICTAGLLTGCLPHETYEIEMRAEKDGTVRRTLGTAWAGQVLIESVSESQPATAPSVRAEPASQPADLQREKRWEEVVKTYGGNPGDAIPNGPVHLKGTFDTKLPFDVGNHGYVLNYSSRLGRFVMYGEHFRGSDSPAEQIEQRLKTVDTLTDFLVGWFDLEFAGDPELPKLRTFLDKTFRRDAKNIAVYLWRSDSLPREERGKAHLAQLSGQVGVYLLQEGYLTKQDFARAVSPDPAKDGEDGGYYLDFIATALHRKAGLKPDGLVKRAFLLLMDSDECTASLNRHIKALAAKGLIPSDASEGKSEFADPRQLFAQAFDCRLDILDMEPELTVTFHCPVEPDYTNGTWDEKTEVITWKRVIGDEEGSDSHLPTGLYAVWTAPDTEAQKRLLPPGRLLSTDELRRYCLWRATLTAAQAKLYDAHLDAVAKAADRQAVWDRFFKDHGKEPRFAVLHDLLVKSPETQPATQPAGDGK